MSAHERTRIMTLDATFDALNAEVWIDKDDAGELWSGTPYWAIASTNRTPKEGVVAKLVAGVRDTLHEAVVLDPLLTCGHNTHVQAFAREHAVYVRPDGKNVLVNLAFLKGLEMMLAEEDEYGETVPCDYLLAQAGDVTRPIAMLDQDKNILAIVMPVKTR